MLIATLAVGMSSAGDPLIASNSWEAIVVQEAPVPSTGGLQGHVYDKETGQPVPGVSVSFQAQIIQTDIDGYYELGDLPAGLHEFVFMKGGYQIATRQAMIIADDWTTLDVELTPGEGPEPEPAFPWWLVGVVGVVVVTIATKKQLKKP